MIKVRYYGPLLAAVMLISVIVFQSWQLSSLLSQREWQHSEFILQNVGERTQAYLNRRYIEGDKTAVQQVMSEINIPRRVTQAFLIDSENRVVAADRLGFAGAPIGEIPVSVNRSHLTRARGDLQSYIDQNRSAGTLTAYYPVSMAPEGEDASDKSAVLLINVEVARGMDEVSDLVLEALSSSMLVIVLLVCAIAGTMHFAVTRRVERMLKVADRYLAGDMSARNAEKSTDEIGAIARAFNAGADAAQRQQNALQDSQDEISKLNQSLEQRVLKRTHELETEIEERKKAEGSLKVREMELQQVLELAPDGIIVIDRFGTITKFNHAAEKLFGWTKDEAIGTNLKYMMPEPTQSNHDQILATYHKTRVRHVIGKTPEVDGLHRSGQHVPISITVSEIEFGEEPYYIGVVRDVSERKANEAALATARQSLLEAEKMASLGGLVAGVAHEINTPVGVGVTAASHLREQIAAFNERYKSGLMTRTDLELLLLTGTDAVQIIEDNLVRASELVRSFKEIAVDQTGDDVREIILHDYIVQVLGSLKPLFKSRPIKVNIDDIPSDLRITLQPGGISQIVTNLVTNSLNHAFGESRDGELRFTARTHDGRLHIAYSDNGVGMAEDVRSRIFDPFFTTMRGRGGSGLGMHIVYNLVTQKYNGAISCDSAPEAGVTFNIDIPLTVSKKLKHAKAK